MICVSSFRPLKECSPSILRNQLKARESWEDAFNEIVYFGSPETALNGDTVMFIPTEQFPRIVDLVRYCADQVDWCAIVNADIVIRGNMRQVQGDIMSRGGLASISRRYEFVGEDFMRAKLVDTGLDFFAAHSHVWRHAAKLIPRQYRIGHCLFDTWLLGFLATHYMPKLWDITPLRMIFHPKHEDRRPMFHIDKEQGKEQLGRVRWPCNRLTTIRNGQYAV